MLRHGAPPLAGRLAAELIARGSVSLTMPACARCGRDGRPLFRTAGGGMCKPCTARVRTAACAHCGEVKAIAGRDASGQCICERCRRHARGHRACGHCGREAPIAVRARDGAPDICVNCYRLPAAVCSGCGKYRPCNFAASDRPVCPSCSPKATSACARCGQDRPPAGTMARRPGLRPVLHGRAPPPGPVRGLRPGTAPGLPARPGRRHLRGLRRAARHVRLHRLRHRGQALRKGTVRPVQPAAARHGAPVGRDRGRPRGDERRARGDLRGPQPAHRAELAAQGASAAILADIAAGRTAATHEALDEHPRPRAAGFLRQMLTAGGVLPPRDEELTRAEQWLAGLLESLDVPEHRRLVRAFATWQVMRRLRQNAQARPRHRTRTASARNSISEAARFLAWLGGRGTTLRQCRQADIDEWLTTASASASESTRDFLAWAARHGHCPAFAFPGPAAARRNRDQRQPALGTRHPAAPR